MRQPILDKMGDITKANNLLELELQRAQTINRDLVKKTKAFTELGFPSVIRYTEADSKTQQDSL